MSDRGRFGQINLSLHLTALWLGLYEEFTGEIATDLASRKINVVKENRRLEAKGSYLTLVRVADRIL